MIRKVIQLAGKTHVVSLPAKWVKAQGIKKGDELSVEDIGRGLLVKKEGLISTQTTAKISIDDYDVSTVWMTIMGLYRAGFETIELTFLKPTIVNLKTKEMVSIFDLIKEITARFVGLEIIGQGKKHIILREVSQPKPEEFINAYRRLLFTITTGLEDAISAIAEQDYKLAKRIANHINEQTNRLTDFCIRIRIKQHSDIYLLQALPQIEQIGDVCEWLIQTAKKKNISLLKHVLELLRIFNSTCLETTKQNLLEFSRKKRAFTEAIKKEKNRQLAGQALEIAKLAMETIACQIKL